jgi:hypothetical protein
MRLLEAVESVWGDAAGIRIHAERPLGEMTRVHCDASLPHAGLG